MSHYGWAEGFKNGVQKLWPSEFTYRPNSPASLMDPLWLNRRFIHYFLDKAFSSFLAKFLPFLMIFQSSEITQMSRPLSHNGSIKEADEFGLHVNSLGRTFWTPFSKPFICITQFPTLRIFLALELDWYLMILRSYGTTYHYNRVTTHLTGF